MLIALMAVKPCRGWRLWWRFGYGPILAVVNRLPIAEWRKDAIGWRIDIAAMNAHRRLHP
jgi:hypothetical protein